MATGAAVISKLIYHPPKLEEATSYEEWKKELCFWSEMSGVEKKDQGPLVMMIIPNECKYGNGLRSSLMGNFDLSEVRTDDGLSKVTGFLDDLLGKSSVTRILEAWEDFMKFERVSSQSVRDFITSYEAAVRKLKEVGQDLDESSRTFIMLNKAKIPFSTKSLIMSQIDIKKKDVLYKSVRALCIQSLDGMDNQLEDNMSSLKIKDEPVYVCNDDNVYAVNDRSYRKTQKFFKKGTQGKNKDRKENPKNRYGFVMACSICASKSHLFKECPERAGSASAACTTETDAEAFLVDFEEKYIFLTENKEEMSQFTCEALNCAALDTCCTSSVAGERWLGVYLKALPASMRKKVEGPFKSTKRFTFANKQSLKSMKMYNVPICPTGSVEMITVDVIGADIPLLMSKKDMKGLDMVINLSTDKAEVKGKEILLDSTTAGHFIMPLLSKPDHFDVFAVDLKVMNEKEKSKALHKLHLQFGHRPKDVFVNLLKNAGSWTNDMSRLIDQIIDGCEGCILRKRNPDRPAVSLPMASEFNEKVCIDLKHWKDGYILYMIDMYSRYTAATYIKRKVCNDVVDSFMKGWVAHYGCPGAILNDNGGEFIGAEMKELKEALGSVDCTTAAQAPWQNGLCERNHAVVDNILSRIVVDFPKLDIQTALAWACSAKNSLQQVYGFSSYQLVFGKNPRLPNILTDGPPVWEEKDIGKTLADHLNLLHRTREEFIKSESASRIKKALKSKVRATVLDLKPGDLVYYKKDGEEFKGPVKVIVQDGKVIFIRDGFYVHRVCANRVVKVGQEFNKATQSAIKLPQKSLETESSKAAAAGIELSLDESWNENTSHENLKQVNQESNVSRKRQAEDNYLEGQPDVKNLRVFLKKDDVVEVRHDDKSVKYVVLGPAGKAIGKNKNWYNVEDMASSEQCSVNFGEVNFEIVGSLDEVYLAMMPRVLDQEDACYKAKADELEKLRDFETYEEVDFTGQEVITSRWVITSKGNQIKARLVARGFQEDADVVSDSPTMTKASLRCILTLAAMNDWSVETVDIKSAFLQGMELDRPVFIKPPREADTGKIWKLKKCLYGLKDASRQWYRKVDATMVELECVRSAVDPSVYLYVHEGKVYGVLGSHVDDFLYAGNAIFMTKVIDRLPDKFKVGKQEKNSFTYTGFKIQQEKGRIVLDQQDYVSKLILEPMDAERMKQKKEKLTALELTGLRKYVGALNWIVRATRPDLSFDLVHLSTRFSSGMVEDLISSRKLIKNMGQVVCKVVFPKLDRGSLKIIVYTDASFGNLNDGVDSMGGHIVFISDKNNFCAPLDWVSCKIKRVVRSTIAAETLALCDGLDNAIFTRSLLAEMIGCDESEIGIKAVIDNKSCFEAVYSTSLVDDKRLRRDIAAVQELLRLKTVEEIQWVGGEQQLADVMTKSGVNGLKLLEVIQSGRF